MAELELIGVSKRYADQVAVSDVSLQIASGEFLSLLGPSGCGKTTLLRIIAGLVDPSEGQIKLGDRDITRVPVHKRGLGLVFQSYALFPHMNVADNVAYGLRRQGLRGQGLRRRVDEALALVRMTHLAGRLPRQLSGGQQQRVALARAIAPRPRLLLLDEPLSNLDALLRDEMQIEIRRLQQELGITSIFVTHDRSEALSMSDRVCVLGQGRLQQIGTPEDIYQNPANSFVAGFIGRSNRLQGRTVSVGLDGAILRLANGTMIHSAVSALSVGQEADIVIRYDAIRLSVASGAPDQFSGEVILRSFSGPQVQLVIRASTDMDLIAEIPSHLPAANFAPGTRVDIAINPAAVFAGGRPS
ncbi:ABC transporter ATP-binding protein [Acidisoma cellulosilytica]|uniref:ABC transporter ATP-binding protein n=1 Tax=Acidisoma cellulosilyticum TaxID=2802395 RepID=A0A963Z4L9_9PROT|nr:ABC transporter ATP-binding protein [Acidisoma cellulosilyticum]MCB8882724.1 ABC transporter ATP-binding protein [Acidisoma cellulosilyticum]